MTNLIDIITPGREASSRPEKKIPGRSGIAFPYASLEEAVDVARVIFENGDALLREQIEGHARFPNVRMRLAAARMFNLITERQDAKFALTELGNAILSDDEVEARMARVQAFTIIPLYAKALETFRNRNLPSRPEGLENAFVGFGVVEKQKDRARLAFERSANFAGFFEANKDRLVEPIISRAAIKTQIPQPNEENQVHRPKPELGRKEILPLAANEFLIKGLLDRLPPTGEPWSIEDRARWLKALSVNLEMIYGDGKEKREIQVTVPDATSQAATILEAINKSRNAPESSKPVTPGWDDEIPF